MRQCLKIGVVVCAIIAAHGAAAQDRAVIESGETVYKDHCAICHGERLVSPGAAFDLRKLGKDDRARFDKAMAEGKGQMPAWEGVLSPEEFEQLWAYVRSRSNN